MGSTRHLIKSRMVSFWSLFIPPRIIIIILFMIVIKSILSRRTMPCNLVFRAFGISRIFIFIEQKNTLFALSRMNIYIVHLQYYFLCNFFLHGTSRKSLFKYFLFIKAFKLMETRKNCFLGNPSQHCVVDHITGFLGIPKSKDFLVSKNILLMQESSTTLL